MTMSPHYLRLRWTTCLIGAAIAGVLSMHGLDPATVTVGASDHPTSHGDIGAAHHLVGLCVFVITAAALLVSGVSDIRRRGIRVVIAAVVDAGIPVPVVVGGKHRLFELCVLRL